MLSVLLLPGCGDEPSAHVAHDTGDTIGDGVCSPGELPIALDLIDLGTLDGVADSLANATGLNNLGEVVGISDGGEAGSGFYWDGATMHEIPATETMAAFRAQAINDHGEIVGEGMQDMPETGGWGAHAFSWSGGDIAGLGTELMYSSAFGLNNEGIAVGVESGDAMVWDMRTGEERYRGALDGAPSNYSAVLNDIGDDHTAVGQSTGPDGFTHAVYWTEATGMVALSGIGGSYGDARGVSADGWILSEENDALDYSRCLLYSPEDGYSEPTDLGTVDTVWEIDSCLAEALNAHHMAVGWDRSAVFSGIQARAWVWSDGVKLDLNSLLSPEEQIEWQLTSALDINDSGQIVGIAIHNNIPGRAWLATPICR